MVAGEVYEIAHDALVAVWPRLRGWIDEASDARVAATRLEKAATQWDRLGQTPELLWGAPQLRELDALGVEAGEGASGGSELVSRFVQASRAHVRNARLRRLAVRVGGPALLVLLVAGVLGLVHGVERRETAAFVAARLAEADAHAKDAYTLDAAVDNARKDAFARYDDDDWAGGEALWKQALALASRASSRFGDASAAVSAALTRDQRDPSARVRAADLAYRWYLAAEREHQADLMRDLRARLDLFDDDGSRRARLDARARLRVTFAPPTPSQRATLARVRVEEGGRRVERDSRPIVGDLSLNLDPGSYVLEAGAPGRYTTRQPILLNRGDDELVSVTLPLAADVPEGFVYVPAGTSLFGAADIESVRLASFAQPQHPIHVDAFFAGKYEVTYADYLAFLATLSPEARSMRRPHGRDLELVLDGPDAPRLSMNDVEARRGEPFCRRRRSARRCQDWLRFPVADVSWDDAAAYAAWMAIAKLPGARLCTEREWERLARGADGRLFPGGDDLRPGDANFGDTYQTDGQKMGVDEVGSFATDASPFGAFDLAGNLREWVGDSVDLRVPDQRVSRGGFWHGDAFNARGSHRNPSAPIKTPHAGLRLCLDAPRT